MLQPRGVLRLSFPDASRVSELPFRDLLSYADMLERKGVLRAADKSDALIRRSCMRAVLTEWGHVSAWNQDLAWCVLTMVGFELVHFPRYGESVFAELRDIDGHHHAHNVGAAAQLETTVVEAVKR